MRKINKCTGNYQCYHFLFFNENKSEWDKKNIRLFFDMVYKKQTWAEVKENSKDDFTFLLRRTLLYIWLSHFAQPLSVLFILLVSFHFSLLSLTAYSIYSIVSFSRFVLPFSYCSFVHRRKVQSICSRDLALIILPAVCNSMNKW